MMSDFERMIADKRLIEALRREAQDHDDAADRASQVYRKRALTQIAQLMNRAADRIEEAMTVAYPEHHDLAAPPDRAPAPDAGDE